MNSYISTPLAFKPNSNGKSLWLSLDVEDRIEMLDKFIELVVYTPRGRLIADPDFGFEYWNHEYSNIHKGEFNDDHNGLQGSFNDITRKECEDSIRYSLNTYYPQLHNVNIQITLNDADAERQRRRKVLSKYSVKVIIDAIINDGLSTERDYHKEVYFLVEPTTKPLSF